MKAQVVTALVRLYPAGWRAEYGEELAELLMRRPLGCGAAANVVANAVRQQWREQEPWLLIGAPLLVWMIAYLVLALVAPRHAKELAGKPTMVGVLIFFGVGFWTVWRKGEGGGRAAMKLSIILTLPVFLLGFLVMMQILPTGPVRPFVGNGREDLVMLFVAPILQIPYAGLLGWVGGGVATRVTGRRG
jgi:hypothetical protein